MGGAVMNGFVNIMLLETHGIRAFIGGCYLRGIGSKFRAKAHSHNKERIVCFRGTKWISFTPLLLHEVAHILTSEGHTDKWRIKVLELGGTIKEVPGVMKSYEKKKRTP